MHVQGRGRRRVVAASAFTVALLCAPQASTPVFWRISTQAELLRGDVENLSIDSHSRLMLGPATELIYESTAPSLWSLLAASDGTLYTGSGNDGKVVRIDPQGAASVFFDAPELVVHALALAPDGALYVGTSPEAKIYKVEPNGTATTFFDPDDRYIWALAVDQAGTVYAATGEQGVVCRISPDGRGVPFYDTRTTHAISLPLDASGNLLVGTASPGRIFRVDRQGKGFVVLDSTFQEVRALRFDERGRLYAAAMAGRAPSETRPPARSASPETADAPSAGLVPSVSVAVTSVAFPEAAVPIVQSIAPGRDERRATGAVYRVTPDGTWDIMWQSKEDYPYDLTFDASGLLVGTGPHGKIYRLAGDPLAPTLLTRAVAQQVTAVARGRHQRAYYATANPGNLWRVASEHAAHGTYASPVRDARTVAAWGTLSWRASVPRGSQIALYTRSGNVATPDDTWSVWAGPYKNPEGEPISSPTARYLQWKAVFTGKDESPILTSVTAAYLPRNSRPQVASITVHPSGIVFQRPFSSEPEIAGLDDQRPERRVVSTPLPFGDASGTTRPAAVLGRRTYQKGLQTFTWHAEDEDGDALQYDVWYRREGEITWTPLRRGLSEQICVWDTTSVPDGTYIVKVAASDSGSNAPNRASIGELESSAFDIDNTPPTITITGVQTEDHRILMIEVRDGQSAVTRVEYSLDAERWRPLYPKDGIADSRVEQFELMLDGEAANDVIIRAVDAMNNVATSPGEPEPRRIR